MNQAILELVSVIVTFGAGFVAAAGAVGLIRVFVLALAAAYDESLYLAEDRRLGKRR